MSDDMLEDIYRDYITTLNERRFDDLGQFVHSTMTYNGAPWTLSDYQSLLRSDVVAIPDLRYQVLTVVTDGTQVAARLWFDCTPSGTFLDLEASGRRVQFGEHVFYLFRNGRICDVWSLIDKEAVRRQLAA